MRKLQIKFPNQIRISGWDFGSSARAMNQAGEKDLLMTYEPVSFAQAVRAKYARMTFERKIMSTKTSIKRIALVAVASLGLSFVATAPSKAAFAAGAVTQGSVTLDNTVLTYAGRVGQQVSIAITGDVAANDVTNPAQPALSVAAAITSQPGTAVYPTLTGNATGFDNLTYQTAGLVFDDQDGDNTSTGSASTVATINWSGDTTEDITATADQSLATLTFTPNAVGTYTIVVWNEKDRTITNYAATNTSATSEAALSGSESYLTFTVNVSAGVSTITLTPVNSTTAIDSAPGGNNGSLVKVTIKDAAGNAAALTAGESISVDPSGTGDVAAVNDVAKSSDAGAAYSLTNADFTAGVAYLNIINATAETVTLNAALSSNSAIAGTTTLVFKTIDTSGDWDIAPTALSTGWAGSANSYTTGLSSSISYTVSNGDATADADFLTTEYANVTVCDESGKITGLAGACYDLAIINAGTFTVTAAFTAANQTYTIQDDEADINAFTTAPDTTVTAAARNVAAAGITVSPTSVRAAVAGSVPFSVTVKDQFGVAYANGRVTLSLTGRNSAQATQSATTNSSGIASFTVTDTALSTATLTSDTVTITAYDEDSNANPSSAPTITWSNVAVGSVTLTAEDEDSTIAGTVSTDISAAAAGATGSSSAPYATVKDAAGNVLSGVPVTFTISGLTGAEIHTTKVTVYTNASGVATTAISSYAAGKVTVTATAGGKSDTDYVYFKQKTATEARTIAATSANGGVTATVTDRYGNAIEGVTVNATRASGTGFFANGSSSTSGTTDKNGQVEFKFDGAGSVKVAFTAEDYGQSADAAAKVGTTAVTAAAAGDSVTNQKGLGASLAPAGVNSVTIDVTGGATSSDAIDAANEATDAANAATDAANAAAEAADAATAAAQDAQAAVAELATKVASLIAGIKAQITTLTNLVIKIQKKVRA